MKRFNLLLTALILMAFMSKNEEGFIVAVLGDMPYHLPADYKTFDSVIFNINHRQPEFSVFVGDIKSSEMPCSNNYYYTIRDYFGHFDQPLIYTPGDNEWTDCNNDSNHYIPDERLSYLRQVFFNRDSSFGQHKMALKSMAEEARYSIYRENSYWMKSDILFMTLHVVGSNNNLRINTNDSSEFALRTAANLFWLETCFALAAEKKCKGIVVFSHADMFTPDKGQEGFEPIILKLRQLCEKSNQQILWVNGDSHSFKIDKPLKSLKSGKTLYNFTRLTIYGDRDMQPVYIQINPYSSDEIFNIKTN